MDQPAQKRVSKACDACKRRKVKCNGQSRCQQCAHLGLRCIYSASGKTRSQGKRGHIISEFRNQTFNTAAISPPILPANAGQVGYQVPYGSLSPTIERNGSDGSMSLLHAELDLDKILIEGCSISSLAFPGAIQQSIFSRSHSGLCRWCLSCSARHLGT